MYTRVCVLLALVVAAGAYAQKEDALRTRELSDLHMGMFVCWSLSTPFSGYEWTRGVTARTTSRRPTRRTRCKTAKEAGMGYILFLRNTAMVCLWDTKTTEFKVPTPAETGCWRRCASRATSTA